MTSLNIYHNVNYWFYDTVEIQSAIIHIADKSIVPLKIKNKLINASATMISATIFSVPERNSRWFSLRAK